MSAMRVCDACVRADQRRIEDEAAKRAAERAENTRRNDARIAAERAAYEARPVMSVALLADWLRGVASEDDLGVRLPIALTDAQVREVLQLIPPTHRVKRRARTFAGMTRTASRAAWMVDTSREYRGGERGYGAGHVHLPVHVFEDGTMPDGRVWSADRTALRRFRQLLTEGLPVFEPHPH